MSSPTSFKTFLRAEVRALDAQFDAGGTLELGLAAAAVRLAYPCLHGRHAARLLEERFSEEEERSEALWERCSRTSMSVVSNYLTRNLPDTQ